MTRLDIFISRIPIPHKGYLLRSAISVVTFMLMAFIVFMIARTLYSPEPLRYKGGVAYVEQVAGVNFFVEQRSFVGERDVTVAFYRKLYKRDVPEVVLHTEGGVMEVSPGEIRLIRQGMLPFDIIGEWCSEVHYTWWPSYSQVEFHSRLPDLCFVAPPTKTDIQ